MGVQLNIKDPETVRLARDLASRKGKSVTETIRNALERIDAEERDAQTRRREEIDAIVADFQRHMPEEWRAMTSKEIMDSIYDDNTDDGFAT